MPKTALYRFFDAEDVLLYVGISKDPMDRFKAHIAAKPDITKVRVIEPATAPEFRCHGR